MKRIVLLLVIQWPLLLAAQTISKKGAQLAATLRDVTNAEKKFAATAAATNTKDAFLSFLANDGVVTVKGKIVNGKETWNNRQADSSRLYWYPNVADVAPSGDLAYTSGPWQYKVNKTDAAAVAFGHFNSIWKKQPGGDWKVMIDLGIAHANTSATFDEINDPVLYSIPNNAYPRNADYNTSKASLLSAEKDFINNYNSSAAYNNLLLSDVRLYRSNHVPYIGQEAAKFLLADTSLPAYEWVGGDVAASGDWGYVYGNMTIPSGKQGPAPLIIYGNYLRIWKRTGDGKWKIAVDVVTQ